MANGALSCSASEDEGGVEVRLSGAFEKEEERWGRQRGGLLPNLARPATPAAVLKYNKVKLIFTPQSKTNHQHSASLHHFTHDSGAAELSGRRRRPTSS